jgi:hypothetical protein
MCTNFFSTGLVFLISLEQIAEKVLPNVIKKDTSTSPRSRGAKGTRGKGSRSYRSQPSPSTTDGTTEETTETDSQPTERERSEYNGHV